MKARNACPLLLLLPAAMAIDLTGGLAALVLLQLWSVGWL